MRGKQRLAIRGPELALEVGGPGAIGLGRNGEGRSRVLTAATWLAWLDTVVTDQDAVDRIGAGHGLDGRIILKEPSNLAGSPDIALVRAMFTEFEDPLHHEIGRGMRTRSRTV